MRNFYERISDFAPYLRDTYGTDFGIELMGRPWQVCLGLPAVFPVMVLDSAYEPYVNRNYARSFGDYLVVIAADDISDIATQKAISEDLIAPLSPPIVLERANGHVDVENRPENKAIIRPVKGRFEPDVWPRWAECDEESFSRAPER